MSWIVVIIIPSTCRAVSLKSVDSVDSIGDEGGGVGGDNDDVRERVGPGDDFEDEMSEGVRSDEGNNGSEGQTGEGGVISTSTSSKPRRLKSSEW